MQFIQYTKTEVIHSSKAVIYINLELKSNILEPSLSLIILHIDKAGCPERYYSANLHVKKV